METNNMANDGPFESRFEVPTTVPGSVPTSYNS